MASEEAEDEAANLRIALEHRTVIGIAIGILMERYRIDSDAAFNVLARISQNDNIKVHVLARDVAEGRDLPLP